MSCQSTDTAAAAQALEDFDASVFCLINQQRAAHGRNLLRPNGQLHRAAYDYATSMELGGFFSHYGDFFGHPAGATPISRLRQIGYIRSHNVWIVGENLHWTTAEQSTPAEVVQAWMNSPEHRKYLLNAQVSGSRRGNDPGHSLRPLVDRRHHRLLRTGSAIHDALRGDSRRGSTPFPHLGGSSPPTHGTCLAGKPPWLYFGFAVPDRTGGQITDRQAGADRDWAPGEFASPDPYDLTGSQFDDRNVRPTGLLDRQPESDH